VNTCGIVRQQQTHICPFCHKQLNVVEYAKRKTLKICKCGKCGNVIDEKIIKY
jgi:ribosomal protein L37AE/L43A